jgi:hypothetical protein
MRKHGWLVAILGVGFVSVQTLDASLAAMHPPAAVSGGASSVATPLTAFRQQAATDVFRGWSSWTGAEDYASVEHLLTSYVILDLLLIALPLALLLRFGLRRAADEASGLGGAAEQAGGVARRLRWGAPLAYFAADALETITLRVAYPDGGGALTLVGLASAVKWLALALAVATLILTHLAIRLKLRARAAERSLLASAGLLLPPAPPPPARLAPVIVALRPQVAVVTLTVTVMLLLPGDVGRQVGDLVLALPDNDSHWRAALFGAALLSLMVAITGRSSVAAYGTELDPPPVLTVPALWLIGVCGVLAILIGTVIAVLPGEDRWWLPLTTKIGTGWTVVVLGAGATLFAVLSSLVNRQDAADNPGPSQAVDDDLAGQVLRVLSAVPLLVLATGAIRGAIVLATVTEWDAAASLGVLATVAVAVVVLVGWLTAAGGAAWLWRAPQPPAGLAPGPSWRRLIATPWAAAAVGLALALAHTALPGLDTRLGAVFVLLWTLTSLLFIVVALAVAGDRLRASGVLAFLRLRRWPVLTLAFVVFATTSALNRDGRYHDVVLADRLVDSAEDPQDGGAEGPPPYAVPVGVAFERWTEQFGPKEGKRERVPMVFIASAGGGIRAAYWTAIVLDCLAGRDLPGEPSSVANCSNALPDGADDLMFAASGISGGSVGLAGWRAAGDEPVHEIFAGQQFLAPNIAAMMFRDLPNGFMHLDDPWPDRAATMEEAWTSAHDGFAEGFFASAYQEDGSFQWPLLLLNGATVDGGCRLVASVLDLAPPQARGNENAKADPPASGDEDLEPDPLTNCVGVVDASIATAGVGPTSRATAARTRDLADFACAPDDRRVHDISLATAAHLSARFPFVSPSGGLTACYARSGEAQRRTFVVDGGLIDSSGAGPLVELWLGLAPSIERYNADRRNPVCITPRLLLIDNGYVDTSRQDPPRRPPELMAPLNAAQAASSTVTPAARQGAVLAFEAMAEAWAAGAPGCSVAGGAETSVVHLYPEQHPGPMAPLGWTLSSWSERDLQRQLMSERNQAALERVHGWFNKMPGAAEEPAAASP